ISTTLTLAELLITRPRPLTSLPLYLLTAQKFRAPFISPAFQKQAADDNRAKLRRAETPR
ncbi:MAG: hypothetical protein FWF01_02390, partial [Alphaproteobacteria bacterium]|nr:hypothetical protein [Alphaproteobacteria bacterium]